MCVNNICIIYMYVYVNNENCSSARHHHTASRHVHVAQSIPYTF